ncbi:DUF4435 domain-containing protein [Phascolarctobacterium faecium]|jgi:ABC-type cobalamin/Fe3+-siderophores transport system ATPase subunit|uniref:DUF4435 domain-containing protein n=1 Tax=Phascolarctobacterium faecium TaxID=33025 RepID=UPI0026DBB7AA|nr:AAA family ATPase [Phascolarctobacterium faecium]
MEIKLPDLDGQPQTIIDKSSMILIGANGSGKTRMSIWIEKNNPDSIVHRISAQKSLDMPEQTQNRDISVAYEKWFFGINNENKKFLNDARDSFRWGKKPVTHLLNDFSELLEYLMAEEFKINAEFREKYRDGKTTIAEKDKQPTKLDYIRKLWHDVLPNKELKLSAGHIDVVSGVDIKYHGSEMSDGERAIFYYIGEIISAPPNSIVIIDEPENHLHKSILVRLWNSIEEKRKDCFFIYLTHNLDFAVSRLDSQIIWVKEYLGENNWSYQIIDDTDDIKALSLEILGNRQKILLIEGDKERSLDYKLYSIIFNDYNVIPVGSCQKVIQHTKTCSELSDKHYLDVKGIIDIDRRDENELNNLRAMGVFSLNVAEIENLFLLPEVVEYVFRKMSIQDEDIVKNINIVNSNILNFLDEKKAEQALLFTKKECENKINEAIHRKSTKIEEYIEDVKNIRNMDTFISNTYKENIDTIERICSSRNIDEALKILNNKGVIQRSGVLDILKMSKDGYINLILRSLQSEKSSELISVFKSKINIDD